MMKRKRILAHMAWVCLILVLLGVGAYAQEEGGADEAETDAAVTDEAETDEADTDEAETDEAETDEAETDEAETDEAETDEAMTDEAETDEAAEAGTDSGDGSTTPVDTSTISWQEGLFVLMVIAIVMGGLIGFEYIRRRKQSYG